MIETKSFCSCDLPPYSLWNSLQNTSIVCKRGSRSISTSKPGLSLQLVVWISYQLDFCTNIDTYIQSFCMESICWMCACMNFCLSGSFVLFKTKMISSEVLMSKFDSHYHRSVLNYESGFLMTWCKIILLCVVWKKILELKLRWFP